MSWGKAKYEELEIGEQLAHLEYVITAEKLQLFREAVEYQQAQFPSIAAKEYLKVLTGKYGYVPVISIEHEDLYYSPPRLNKRIQVTGWVRAKCQRLGRHWLVVETLAIDEDGTEIVRSRHTFLIDGLGAGWEGAVMAAKAAGLGIRDSLTQITRTVTQEKMDLFEAVGQALTATDEAQAARVPANIHTDPNRAREMGLDQPVASGQMSFAFIHELLARRFGDDFRRGGKLTVTFRQPVSHGDTVTTCGLIAGETKANNRTTLALEVWQQNQRGEKTAAGTAEVTIPSPLA